jgi:hypothetical protein
MTELEWLAATDPTPMLAALRDAGGATDRRLRLFAVACCRRIWHLLTDEKSRAAIELAESYADGEVTRELLYTACHTAELVVEAANDGILDPNESYLRLTGLDESSATAAWFASDPGIVQEEDTAFAAAQAARFAKASWDVERQSQANLLRDICPNPFRAVPAIPSSIRTWNNGTVKRLAQSAYEDRLLPAGTLDNARLAVLADALEEAGCQEVDVLRHLREQGRVHVRGFWVLDSLLGKE